MIVFSTAGTGWADPSIARYLPLPTQDCCCHRIEVIGGAELPPEHQSVVVSELASSKVFQVKLRHLISSGAVALAESEPTPEEAADVTAMSEGVPYRVRKFHDMGGNGTKRQMANAKWDDMTKASRDRAVQTYDAMRRAVGPDGDGVVRISTEQPCSPSKSPRSTLGAAVGAKVTWADVNQSAVRFGRRSSEEGGPAAVSPAVQHSCSTAAQAMNGDL